MTVKIVAVLACSLAAFAVFVALRPSTFRVERSISIAAPAAAAFARVNDFHAWAAWSPYEKLDPQMTRSYAGPRSGLGAGYAWASEGKAGTGRMTIEKSEAPALIAIKLEFSKPFKAISRASFHFVPEAGATRVTWAMDGDLDFTMKAFHLLVNMDKLVGGDFEQGLAALKTASESEPGPAHEAPAVAEATR